MFALYNKDRKMFISNTGAVTRDEPRLFRLRGHAATAGKANYFFTDEPGWKVVPVIVEPVEE